MPDERPLVWLHGEVRTPPVTAAARVAIGGLLRRLQQGEALGFPWSRPLPVAGPRCHELRVVDHDVSWRVVYALEPDAVVILDVFRKKTQTTPRSIIHACRRRLRAYEASARAEE
jgi:phage-related protein